MLEIDPHLVANSDKDDFEFVGFATLLVIVFSKTFFLVGLSKFDGTGLPSAIIVWWNRPIHLEISG